MKVKIFENTYDGESLYDLSRDVHEAFDTDFNELVKQIPVDEDGFHEGTFKVSIEWMPKGSEEE